jgi:hypothetical protein
MISLKGDENMNEQFSSMDRREAYRQHAGRFFPILIPLAVGLILGMRKGMLHREKGPGNRWENGVPPFFAELHRRAHAASDQPAETES